MLDHYTSLLTKTNKSTRIAPTLWITSEILSIMTSRQRLERTYIASHSICDLKLRRSGTNHYHKFISVAKKSYYSSLVHASSSTPRALWKTINKILHRTSNRSLPSSSHLATLPQLFATFSDKTTKLHFNYKPKPLPLQLLLCHLHPSFTPLVHPANLLEINNLLSQLSDSYCDLDSVLTTVLKKISNAIFPTMLLIIILS